MEQGDPFDADDATQFRRPLPAEDRIWRHPSELVRSPTGGGHRRIWPAAIVSGLSGAAVAVGGLAIAGRLDGAEAPRAIVLPAAVRPRLASIGASTFGEVDQLVAGVAGPVVRLRLTTDAGGDRYGAGVLFRADGHLLTNAHVVVGPGHLEASLADGRTVGGHVVGMDAETDIAVVQLDAAGPFTTAKLGTTDGMGIGEPVIAVGASVTTGLISAMGREIRSGSGSMLIDMIQTDAPVDAQSSGGALLDNDGAVVGITTAYAAAQHLGFATPIDVARAVADDLLGLGRVRSVWLGVKGSPSTDGGGVAVAGVVPDGPADHAGLRPGDVIRRIDGRPVTTMSGLRIVLRRCHPGTEVRVVFDREGVRRSDVVVPEERPPT